jgi:tripartite-type tricarboxylate transporter receptor subunit TctC
MIRITRRGALLAAPFVLGGATGSAQAQAWPARQVRIVVGFAAGGANDIMARLLAAKLGERIPGSTFVVENRPGAGTLLAAEHVARQPADGYTYLFASSSTLITLLVNRAAGLDPTQAFSAVSMAQSSPLLLVSRSDFPARTLPQVIELAKQRQGRLTISHPGSGGVNHLSLVMLMRQVGIELTMVPYNGNNPSLTALVRGDVELASDSLFATRALIEAGTIRPIAITSAERSPTYPNVPTFAETVPGYDVTFWGGIMAPRGVPDAILDQLSQELDSILRQPDVAERVRSFGATPVGGTRAHYTKVIEEDWARWGEVVRVSGIKPD